MANNKKERLKVLVFLLFSLFLLYLSLYFGGRTGLSDNGDFRRVMGPNRITYLENSQEPFVFHSQYRVEYKGNNRLERLIHLLFTTEEAYLTTQNVFIKLSLAFNYGYRIVRGQSPEHYSILWLGAVYLGLYLLALLIIAVNIKTAHQWLNWLIYFLLAVMFCDIGYTAYFHSFYGEAAQVVSLMWVVASAIGVVCSVKKRALYVILYYASVILFSGSKLANIPQGIVLALAGLAFLVYFKLKAGLKALVVGCCTVSLATGFLFYRSVPEWMDKHTTYQAVFFGILKGSAVPEKDLRDLGIPEKYSVLANTNYYMGNHPVSIESEEFNKAFYSHISKTDMLGFYLSHPKRLIEKLEVSALNSGHIRPIYLSNSEKAGDRMVLKNKASLWSSFRLKLFLNNIYVILLSLISSFSMAMFLLLKRSRKKALSQDKKVVLILFLALVTGNAINFLIPVIANGEADLAKHMFSFIMGFDLQMLIIVAWSIFKLKDIPILWLKRFSIWVERRGVLFFITSFILALSLIILPGWTQREESLKPRIGSYVLFGKLDGNPVLWRIIHISQNEALLVTDKPLFKHAYDDGTQSASERRRRYGSNFWPDSSLRRLLNNDFLRCFSDQESAMIEEKPNRCVLSHEDLASREGGSNIFFWSHVPALVDFGFENAYYRTVKDKVFLLDVQQYRRHVVDNKLDDAPEIPYWLETPYYNNGTMTRIVGTDGYVYMKDANVHDIGVRPAIIINLGSAQLYGEGSKEKPIYITGITP